MFKWQHKIVLILIFLGFSLLCKAQGKTDHLKANLKDLDPKERIEVLNRLAETFITDSIELCLEYYILAYDAAVKFNDVEIIIKQAEKVADLYTQLGKYNNALEYYEFSLYYAGKLPGTDQLSRIYRLKGNAYYYLGEYDKCLESHMQTLHYAEMNKDEGGIAAAYNNIGLINMKYQKFDTALEYYLKAEKMFAKTENYSNQGRAIINIGNIYYFKKEPDNALGYYQRALNIFEKINDISEIALAAQNISVIYDEKSDTKNAIHYGEKALNLYVENNDVWGITNLSKNLGYLYLRIDDIEKSEHYLAISLEHANKTNSLPLMLGTHQALTDMYEVKGDFENAFKHLKQEFYLADSISRMETTEKLTELESKYQLDQKEKENKLVWQYFTYISILSFLVVVILLFNYRLKVRSNKQLKEKNIEIENQNLKLEEINATKNKFFSIIAHDLKNPLAAFIGFMDVIQIQLNEMPKEELQANLKQVGHLAESMLDLLENLLKWGRSQAGVLEFKPTPISILELLDGALRIVSMNAQSKKIDVLVDIKEDITFVADPNMLSTVVRNLLSNAIKFTPKGGRVSITAMESENEFKLLVKDNGVGISIEDQQKLFRIDSKFRNHGTESEPGTGLGLILCKEFVEKHGGTMIVESTLNVGSTFGFSLPIGK